MLDPCQTVGAGVVGRVLLQGLWLCCFAAVGAMVAGCFWLDWNSILQQVPKFTCLIKHAVYNTKAARTGHYTWQQLATHPSSLWQ